MTRTLLVSSVIAALASALVTSAGAAAPATGPQGDLASPSATWASHDAASGAYSDATATGPASLAAGIDPRITAAAEALFYDPVAPEDAAAIHSALLPEMASEASATAPLPVAAPQAWAGAGDAAGAETYYAGDTASWADGTDWSAYGYESADAAAAAGWSFDTTGYCTDPSCAQSVVDANGFSYIDYGTGFQTFAGHTEGEAGAILDMNDGDTVSVNGGDYRVTHSIVVPEGATTNDVEAGLALQTCTGDGNMVIRYIEEY